MSVKEFFKSKAFKCILVLLSVLLISGILLTIAYGFLEVTKGERLQRAVNKIYPDETVEIYGEGGSKIEASDKDPKSLVSEEIEIGEAKILSAYKVTFAEDSKTHKGQTHILVQSTGKGGFSGGTVTCWVAVNVDEALCTVLNVDKVEVGSYTGQTFMDKINFLDKFGGTNAEGGYYPNLGYMTTGATMSSTAICNSVNGAVKYVNEKYFGIADQNPFKYLALSELIDLDRLTAKLTGTDVEYTVFTKTYEHVQQCEIKIVVGSDSKIKSYELKTNGSSNDNWKGKTPEKVADGSLFAGKGIDYFTSLYGNDMAYASVNKQEDGTIVSGATDRTTGIASETTYVCMYAGAFAVKNYTAVYQILSGGAK